MNDSHFKFNIICSMRYFVCNMLIWKINLEKGWILKGSIVILKKFSPTVKSSIQRGKFSSHTAFLSGRASNSSLCPLTMCSTDISGTCAFLWTITSHTAKRRTSIQEYYSLNKHSCLYSNFENVTATAIKGQSSEWTSF